MSKGNRRIKSVSGAPISSYDQKQMASQAIDFNRAWVEARIWGPKLPTNPPPNLPEEAQQAITVLARRVLQLESEWA